MFLIDTHSHLYEPEFDDDRNEAIERLQSVGVSKVLLPNINEESIQRMLSLEKNNPLLFRSMMGLHPTEVRKDYKNVLERMSKILDSHDYCAIGEIGLDFYWDKTFEKEQTDAFEIQVDWAVKRNLPVALHVRKAMNQVIESLKKFDKEKLYGVFHSFSGSAEMAHEISQLGNFYYGINGVVTFKNAGVAEVVKTIPLDRIVLETDCPYLTPVPYRGQRNETSYVKYVAEKIAIVKEIEIEEVASVTTKNAERLFGL